MKNKICKRCGKPLPADCKGRYCKDCKRRIKETKILVAVSAVACSVVAGGVYIWCKQPEFIKKAVIRSAEEKIKTAEENVLLLAKELEVRGKAMISKSEELVSKVGRTQVTKF